MNKKIISTNDFDQDLKQPDQKPLLTSHEVQMRKIGLDPETGEPLAKPSAMPETMPEMEAKDEPKGS